jgi:hypothetical protein
MIGETKTHKPNPALQAASNLPPLPHFRKGEPFDIMRSQAADWLCQQPEIRQWIWNWAKANNAIVLDLDTHRWQGANLGG